MLHWCVFPSTEPRIHNNTFSPISLSCGVLHACLCTSKLWKRFQEASKDLNEKWTATEKLPKDFNQSDRLEVPRAGSVPGKQAATAITSSLAVKWWQNKKQAETVWDWEYMWAGEMLQSERIKSEPYVKTEATAHILKCPYWQQQINFHTNTDCNFYYLEFFKNVFYIHGLRLYWS